MEETNWSVQLPTDDYLPTVVTRPAPLQFWRLTGVAAVSLVTGFLICRFAWPREVIIKEKGETIMVSASAMPLQNSGFTMEVLANEKIYRIFQESWLGVLEVKDGQAQTVSHKRAALGSKQGFYDLKTNTAYTVHNYFVHNGTGYGLVGNDLQNFFLLVWHSGATKAPAANPGTIWISQGRNIQIGTPPAK